MEQNEDEESLDGGPEYELHSDDSFLVNDLDEDFDEDVMKALGTYTSKYVYTWTHNPNICTPQGQSLHVNRVVQDIRAMGSCKHVSVQRLTAVCRNRHIPPCRSSVLEAYATAWPTSV